MNLYSQMVLAVCCLCVYPEQMVVWAVAKWEISYKMYILT